MKRMFLENLIFRLPNGLTSYIEFWGEHPVVDQSHILKLIAILQASVESFPKPIGPEEGS
jgi:hypothetical protein